MTSADRRAEVIAGIRALADFFEANPEVPEPYSVSAHHGINRPLDADAELLIRRTGDLLGVEPRFYELDDTWNASVRHVIADGYSREDGSFRVQYCIHGYRPIDKPTGGES